MGARNWEHLFSTTILKRGHEYFKQQRIDELDYDAQGITAVVSGSYNYDVEIILNNRGIEWMSCDCPYAEDGTHCKHMAAVLYAWEDALKAPFAEKREPTITLDEAVQALSEENVRSLLLEYARKENRLRNQILIMATGRVDRKQRKSWKKELMLLKQAFEVSCDDYLDYDETYEYFQNLIEFLQKTANSFIKARAFDDAFELICEIYPAIDSDCDDLYGGHEEFIEECEQYLHQIILQSDIEVQRTIYSECLKWCGGRISEENEDLWQNTLLNCFEGAEFLHQNLQLIEQALKNAEKNENLDWLLKLVQDKIGLMQRLRFAEVEILDFRKQYRCYPVIRRMELREAIEENDIASAIQLLKESKRMDADHPNLIREYSQKLIQLYETQKDDDACRSELVEYIFERSNYELEYIRKLKQVSEEAEWRTYLQRLLGLKIPSHIRYELMADEEMYRELLNELETDPYLIGLQRYEMILKPYFEEEVRDVFFAYLRVQMERATGRNLYEELIKRLKKMKMYPDGEAMTQELVEQWKQIYKRRTALLDELKKAGFS